MNFSSLIPKGPSCVAAIGGGGKTGFLERLEKEFSAKGRPALVSVTTRLARGQFPELLRLEITGPAQLKAAAERAAGGERILATAPDLPGDREGEKHYRGLSPHLFTAISGETRDLAVMVEADGSRSRPLKAHREGEPPLPAISCFVLAVLGLTALVLPAGEAVHRPELLAEHLGPIDLLSPLSPALIAAFVKSAWGPLNPGLIFLNQLDAMESQTDRDKAKSLAAQLRAGGFACALGSLHKNFLEF